MANVVRQNSIPSNFSPEESLVRDSISSLHRSLMCPHAEVRQATVSSLELVSAEYPMEVLQTWLDQFARVNGGNSPSEYSAPSRVFLLQGLEKITGKVIEGTFLSPENQVNRALVGRVIAMALEEMTRHNEVMPEVQKPCSAILVQVGEKVFDRVIEALMSKFQPSPLPHYYVVQTLSQLAHQNGTKIVPYLKSIMSTMNANMKSVKKDNMKFAYSSAIANFCEAISDHLVNVEKSPPPTDAPPTLNKSHFVSEVEQAHDVIFPSWLSAKDSKVKHSVLEAVGRMSPLISREKLSKVAISSLNTLISAYKRVQEPFYVTQCVCLVISEVAESDPVLLEPVIEPLLTALFTQMCSQSSISADYSKPLSMKNNHEVLRCYDVLVNSHNEKLIQGLIVRMGSVDENIRLAALKALKHIMNSSLDFFRDRMPDVFRTVHSKLSSEHVVKVKKMLAEVTALLGRLGFIGDNREGRDFLDFILRQCALPSSSKPEQAETESLRAMCSNILQLLASNVPDLDKLLWPRLMDYLLANSFIHAVTAITKSLVQIMMRRKDEDDAAIWAVKYEDFEHITGPYSIFSRMIVLAAIPCPDTRGAHVLSFLQHFAPNINKHIPALWKQRIQLLQHYLETHIVPDSGVPRSTWSQEQWEEWILKFVDDTLIEIDLEEWNSALVKEMFQQLSLYKMSDTIPERTFLVKCMGVVLKRVSSRAIVSDLLNSLFLEVDHNDLGQKQACAMAFGVCGERHFNLALEKLEVLLKSGYSKRHNGLFSFLRDSKTEETQIAIRNSIVLCAGQIALRANKNDLRSKCDELVNKFIMPALKGSLLLVKITALRSVTDLAKAIQPSNEEVEQTIELVHHGDLIHEAIDCMKNTEWDIESKHVALTTTLHLIQCPPFVSQMTRCSLMKACFTAVFPSLVCHHFAKAEDFSELSKKENDLRNMVKSLELMVQVLLKQEMEQSTLDEIFTLLEPWLKKEYPLSREMACKILCLALHTFVENVAFEVGSPTSFAPGPYVIGSLIPRCFDSSRSVQTLALSCLQLSVKILAVFEGHSPENIEPITAKLVALMGMSPNNNDEPLNMAQVARTVSELLSTQMQHEQLYPLVTSAIEGLCDGVLCSARGTSLVICKLLEKRANELHSHTADLVSRFYDILLDIGEMEETRIRILSSIRTICSHSPRQAVQYLLSHPVATARDAVLASIWQVLAQDKTLAQEVLRQLLQEIETESLYQEEVDRVSDRLLRKAIQTPLCSIVALGNMFDTKEMELAMEGEFASVVVPLLATGFCYVGVKTLEPVKGSAKSDSNINRDAKGDQTWTEISNASPFEIVMSSLSAFLTCQGVSSVAKVVMAFPNLGEDGNDDLAEKHLFEAYQTIILDFPQLLPKLASGFQPLLSSRLHGRRLTAAAFYVQLLRTDTPMDKWLKNGAISHLLTTLENHKGGNQLDRVDNEAIMSKKKEENDAITMICLHGLSHFRKVPSNLLIEEEDAYNFGAAILVAFSNVIGEDFKSKVNVFACQGLTKLLKSKSLREDDIHHVLSTISIKIRPFFDCGSTEEGEAAIVCFAELSNFATESYKDVYIDNVHSVMVSLLLHTNNDDQGVAKSSREAMAKILKVLEEEKGRNLGKILLNNKEFNFSEFLEAFFQLPSVLCMQPAYMNKVLGYFKSAVANVRQNAIVLACILFNIGTEESRSEFDREKLCQGLATIMNGDGDRSVQEIAAASLGKILVNIKMNAE